MLYNATTSDVAAPLMITCCCDFSLYLSILEGLTESRRLPLSIFHSLSKVYNKMIITVHSKATQYDPTSMVLGIYKAEDASSNIGRSGRLCAARVA